jgi:predicted nucleotidyltransferase
MATGCGSTPCILITTPLTGAETSRREGYTAAMDRRDTLDRLCREHGLLAVYLFGPRVDDGLCRLQGDAVSREGSDLDIGVVFREPLCNPRVLSSLQVELADMFEPLRVDLVPLQRVDALFQFSAINGHRIAATDPDEADRYELFVMNMASEMHWLKQQMGSEESLFGPGP